MRIWEWGAGNEDLGMGHGNGGLGMGAREAVSILKLCISKLVTAIVVLSPGTRCGYFSPWCGLAVAV